MDTEAEDSCETDLEAEVDKEIKEGGIGIIPLNGIDAEINMDF